MSEFVANFKCECQFPCSRSIEIRKGIGGYVMLHIHHDHGRSNEIWLSTGKAADFAIELAATVSAIRRAGKEEGSGRCPLCSEPIPEVVEEGYQCPNCKHVFETPEKV